MKKTILKLVYVLIMAALPWALVLPAAAQRAQQTATCANGQQVTYDDASSSSEQACQKVGSTPGAQTQFRTFECPNGTTISVPVTSDDNAARSQCTVRGDNGAKGSTGFNKNPVGDSTDCALSSGPADASDNCIVRDVNAVINFVAVGFGVIVTGMMIFAGIRYMMSRDNPQEVAAAKHMILNVVIALAAFIFLYAFLQWLVPGGVF